MILIWYKKVEVGDQYLTDSLVMHLAGIFVSTKFEER